MVYNHFDNERAKKRLTPARAAVRKTTNRRNGRRHMVSNKEEKKILVSFDPDPLSRNARDDVPHLDVIRQSWSLASQAGRHCSNPSTCLMKRLTMSTPVRPESE